MFGLTLCRYAVPAATARSDPCEPPEPEHDALHWEGFGRSCQRVAVMQGLERWGGLGFPLKSVQELLLAPLLRQKLSVGGLRRFFSLPLLTFSVSAN